MREPPDQIFFWKSSGIVEARHFWANLGMVQIFDFFKGPSSHNLQWHNVAYYAFAKKLFFPAVPLVDLP